jgi:hypothetical protein
MPLRHAAVLLAAMCLSAAAQSRDTRTLAQKLEGFDLTALKGRNPADQRDILGDFDPDQHPLAFVYYALPPVSVQSAFKDFLKTIFSARLDQQVGANPSSGGGSGVVSKAGLPSLLSVAIEAGALTQTIDQNVTTLHANGDGLYRFVTNQEVIPICPGNDPSCQPSWAKNLDLSASFTVSGSGTQTLTGQTASSNNPVDLSAAVSKNRFTSATAQYAVLNQRDFRSKQYHDSFLKWFKANTGQLRAASLPLLKAFDDLMNPVQTGTDPFFPHWRQAAAPEVARVLTPQARAEDPQAVEKAVAKQLDLLVTNMRETDPLFDTKLQGLLQAYAHYFASQDQLGRNMITPPQMLIQGSYAEPALQPKLVNVRFSYAWSPGSPNDSAQCAGSLAQSQTQTCSNPGTVTFNAGVDIYRDAQPTGIATNTARFRDAQAALQFDRPLGSGTSPAQLSIGAYYQYQRYSSIFVVPAGSTVVPNTNIPLPPNGAAVLTGSKGSLYLVQAMLTLQIPTAGVKVPIGISWSNRTDLVTGNEVRAHIGLTFNADGPMLSAK